MAKRKVRRARIEGRAPAPAPASASAPQPPAPRASVFRARQFWLGALAAACLLVPLAIGGVVLAARGDDSAAPEERAGVAPTPAPADESEVERLRRVSQARDKEQVEQLTARMRKLGEDLDPVVRGVAKTLPPDDEERVGPLADGADVRKWVRATQAAKELFAETESGDTGTNVARGALVAAVRGLADMTQTYELALERPQNRAALLEQARAQRDTAMGAWETAATQMDVINIAVGLGHQHPPAPGRGASAPDELPEGTDATEGG